ncbi:pyridoxal phosphate-dependent decarboxylase family protein [Nocardia wallacei]|uniref:pyridoxal phosphate-dependent decarboxylase family protein n=1 Tax=Nocardia wallacei TaxID=480035 RepID=UPI002455A943|nr:aminotransferase class V-fold PLP-dependent enzyme [Nocardia wallacei]
MTKGHIDLRHWLLRAHEANIRWQAGFGPFAVHPSTMVDGERFETAFAEYTRRLGGSYPFFHPRYAGQMVKPPHPAAVAGYVTAMLINPNNHALDGGPATTEFEIEAVAQLAEMIGFPDSHLGHLTSSGTMANLEALYVAEQTHPGAGVAYSTDSHYTHERMCRILGLPTHPVPADAHGRMDIDALERLLQTERIGTVVLTAGTTGLGAIDPIDEALALRDRYGVRLHVDAAYGGFFAILGRAGELGLEPGPWRALGQCDSVVVDPHKHGLQPYGCGAVLFRDPRVARFFVQGSPCTYYTQSTSQRPHLGEISLECSRAGAAAGALWLTFRVLPPTRDGLGEILAACRRAALRSADLLAASAELELYQRPDLDIVTYLPHVPSQRLSDLDAACARLLVTGMDDLTDPIFLSSIQVDADAFRLRMPDAIADVPVTRVLRSVLIKPEAESYADELHARLGRLVTDMRQGADAPAR